jgi:hypothetical protein
MHYETKLAGNAGELLVQIETEIGSHFHLKVKNLAPPGFQVGILV